jgi:26S proteasome regulatory subunit N2
MGSEDLIVYEELKNVLFTNQAVTGEAAGMGIGLLMAGTGSMEVFE